MKLFNKYISEKLQISSKGIHYNYHPKDKYELRKLLKKLIKERGQDADLNDIDVSEITDMGEGNMDELEYGLFNDINIRNIDISKWDVSNVTNMKRMFNGCTKFNCNLSKWDVSNVIDMNRMFMRCAKFNSDISGWNISNVEDMCSMFRHSGFNGDLSKWDVNNVEYMLHIFDDSPLDGYAKLWWGRIK